MQTIHLQVEENKLDTMLMILSNFKNDLVKSFTVSSDEKLDDATAKYLKTKQFQEDKAYFQKCLEDIESGKSKCLTQSEYDIEMARFTENLKLNHANY